MGDSFQDILAKAKERAQQTKLQPQNGKKKFILY